MSLFFSIIGVIFFSTTSLFNFSGLLWQQLSCSDFEKGQIINIEDSKYYADKLKPGQYPEISASSAVVVNLKTRALVFEKNSDQVWPIASISKMMSALVLLEDLNLDLEKYYTIKESDKRSGGRQYLFSGDEVKIHDLLALALIPSENTSVIAMISSLGLSEEEFVAKMNTKAKSLGLSSTVFFDPTGLDGRNVSTAKEVAIFLQRALNIKAIQDLARNENYKFETKQGSVRKVFSTNELLNYSFADNYNIKIIGGKTGYNDRAGYCFGAKFVLKDNQEFISVVLNASSLKNRFVDTRKLLEKLYSIF